MTERKKPDGIELLGRPTTQRAEVLQALIDCEDFISAQTLHAVLMSAGSTVGLSTVYRTLSALTASGRTEVVRDGRGERFYRYRSGPEHRHFLICRSCGLSHPLDAAAVELWTEQVARTYGFADVQHTIELSGRCAGCANADHESENSRGEGVTSGRGHRIQGV